MNGMSIQIANMSPERYARTAKRVAQSSIEMSERVGAPVPDQIREMAAASLEELADRQRRRQRDRARNVGETVETTYVYMDGLGITREQYEQMIMRLHIFEYVVVKSTSLEFE